MKIASLDLGDRWIGCALSDALGFIATPYKTVEFKDIHLLINELINQHKVSLIVVGYPRTMRGTESEQTKKVLMQKKMLEETYPSLTWTLWDERLTSQHAARLNPTRDPKKKQKTHAIAAAFILENFLNFRRVQLSND